MGYAVLFPGQGSQAVGMGADVFELRSDLLGARTNEILGWELSELCAAGPDEELTRTDRAQPALYAVAYALWEEFAAAAPEPPVAGAGHSLGEYTALAAAGVFDYETGLRLVAARGEAMSRAGNNAAGSMAVLIGADEETAEKIAAARRGQGGSLWVANLNAPGQIVLAGGLEDIAWVAEVARDFGARRALPLNVSGAFHSPLMEPAAAELAEALGAVEMGEPRFPVWANSTAKPVTNVASSLADQLVSPVRFSESLEGMAAAAVDVFVHIGPGNVTAGLAARSVEAASTLIVDSVEIIPTVLDQLFVE